jgi:hypothetical protein
MVTLCFPKLWASPSAPLPAACCCCCCCRELDLQILRDALEREAAEEAAEEAARAAKRQEVLHYRKQLASMMAKHAADQSEQDAMIEAANRAKQAAEDAEWARRAEARRQLMAEVDAIRQQQIAAKKMAK